ncbi:MAG: Alpha-1,4-N-acetylgalactosamine transferase PglJ [uncultured Thiotrichaceae bacterium]|uniref:Alpha-1,4-N-acetylgalactosamine transferase PglJ n=1 Tax=uncultured Thiotrichaceae bacterium TaxID=298394 RepID=A0A6S6U0Z4_9GAMM|nr:MAG: Alpha-1,4-N-acetylgalactosamine transferase PglJ [uncultured Thiotrichaceae bacterium]
MKIALFFSTSGHSGVDQTAKLLIPEFCKMGHQVDLLKVQKHGPHISPMENLNIIDLGTSHTMSAIGPVKNYLKQEKPDVLLADKDRCNRVALLAKRLSKSETPIVVSSGTIMSENLKNRSWLEGVFHRFSFNYLYPKAHAVITPSQDAATDLSAISQLTEAQITVVPLPIIADDLLIQAKEAVNHPWLEDDIPVIISVGELTDRKDQATQLRALAIILKQQACKLLVLGKGKNEATLKQLAKALDIENHIDFLGFQDNPFKYIYRANIFIHTAKFEGFGMALVEALALGKPVVAANCMGGPAEILQHGKLGELVDVGDSQALADAILRTLHSPNSTVAERIAGVAPYTVKMSTQSYLQVMQ